MAKERRVHAVVSGTVQGVFFRASTLEQAQALGLVGTVQNLPDGEVAIDAQGEPSAIEALLQWVHHGPPHAKVESVGIRDADLDPSLHTFKIVR